VTDNAVVEDYSHDGAASPDAEGPESPATPKQRRDRSSIRFPYSSLTDVVQVAETIHHDHGGRCTPDALAASLDQTASSGAFRIKVSTAQLVGAVDLHRGVLTLTELGRRLADEETRPQAMVQAFRNVELYEKIFNKYLGGRLPRDAGLEADMVAMGVAPKQANRARQAFQRSAEVAGFFWQGRDRLVLPPSGQPGTLTAMSTTKSSGRGTLGEPVTQGPGGLQGRHALIVGLVEEIPSEDASFPQEKREDWLKLAAKIFDILWGKAESGLTATGEESGSAEEK
jgi:hypothetical protein